MRSIWALVLLSVKLMMIEGLPATTSRCERGFEEVLTSRHCDYFAIGPQTLLDSYCSWDSQLSHGITQKFCCLGVCAFCFSDVNRSFETKDEDQFKATTSARVYWPIESGKYRSFRELMAEKLVQMMEQIEATSSYIELLTDSITTTTLDREDTS